jgi:F420-non-reducing hydrogenase iron-sulfur subunit
VEGNYKTLRRFTMLKRMLADMGIEEQRVRMEWISASEGERVKTVINDMVEQVKALGPLNLPGRFADWDKEMLELEHAVQAATSTLDTPHSTLKEVAYA